MRQISFGVVIASLLVTGCDRHAPDTMSFFVTSVPAGGGQPATNARDRIGTGPWFNSRGVRIATNLEELHGTNNVWRNTAMIETGERINLPHDMLTGSNADGTLAGGDATCHNWSSTSGRAVLGHSDRASAANDQCIHHRARGGRGASARSRQHDCRHGRSNARITGRGNGSAVHGAWSRHSCPPP